jgi:hypothetical protein
MPRAFLILVLACVSIRAVIILNYAPAQHWDTNSYVQVAREIRHLDFRRYEGRRTPLYPLLLVLGGLNWNVVRVIQSLLGVAISLMLFEIACAETGNSDIALLAGLAYSLDLSQLFYESAICSETLSTFWVVGSAFFLSRSCRKGGRKNLVLLGVAAGLAGLTRPLFLFLGPLYLAALAILDRSGALAEPARSRALRAFAVPAFVPVLGLCLFNWIVIGYPGPTTMLGYDLSNHSGAFIELAPGRYSGIRDPYLKARAARIARGAGYAQSIWYSEAEMKSATGLSTVGLSRALTRMSLELFAEHPVLYAEGVGRSWAGFWRSDIYWRGTNFTSQSLRDTLEPIWRAEVPLLIAINGMFLLIAGYMAVFSSGRREATAFDLCLVGIVLSAASLQALIEYGDNARFAIPIQPLVAYIVCVNLWRWLRPAAGAAS